MFYHVEYHNDSTLYMLVLQAFASIYFPISLTLNVHPSIIVYDKLKSFSVMITKYKISCVEKLVAKRI